MNMVILIFVGGAFGAICRELLMLGVPSLSDGFPLDILAANIIASFFAGDHCRAIATQPYQSICECACGDRHYGRIIDFQQLCVRYI